MKGRFGVYGTYQATAAVREGYRVVITGEDGAGTATETAALLAGDGVACETVAINQWVTVCEFGECDVQLTAFAVNKGDLLRGDATGLFEAGGANDNIAKVTRGAGASGLARVMFYGGTRINDPA